jgi:hypothetical protein
MTSPPAPPPSPDPAWLRVLRAWKVWVPALVAALAAFGLTVTVTDTNNDNVPEIVIKRTKPAVPVTVGVAGPKSEDAKPDTVITLDREAREVAQNATQTPERFDMAGDLRGEDSTPVAQYNGPLATPNWPGCSTRILPTNWSNRTDSVKGISLHYTAGANRPGLSDMNGLTGFASSPSAGVSWHFLIDAEGHCYYSVPVDKKSWTIGNLNSQLVNIEVIGVGNEPTYPASPAGAKKLGEVVRRIARVYHIPLRLGATDGHCRMTTTGIITHWQGGPCSGGHIDIKPYDVAKTVQAIASGGCDARCARVRSLKARHKAAHATLRARGCGPEGKTRRKVCIALHATNRAIHRAAEREKIQL